jgi:hypothetical protein
MADRTLVARYRLEDPRHLFVAADDPFSPDYGIAPVLDEIVNDLYTTTSLRQVQLTLELPATETTPSAVERIRGAVSRYCDQSVRELDRTRRGERSRAWFALALAVIGLVCFVLVSRATRDSADFWVEVAIEGLTVAFWVAVWFPLDLLLFGQWQNRLDQRIYRAIAAMDLDVVPTGPPPARPRDPADGSSNAVS